MALNKGACVRILANTSNSFSDSNYIEHINVVDLEIDGNPKDVTEFAAATCTAAFTTEVNMSKTIKLSCSGWSDLTATTQAMLWANIISGTAVYVKVGFGTAGAGPTVAFQANIANVKLGAKPDDYQTVDFTISNLAQPTVA